MTLEHEEWTPAGTAIKCKVLELVVPEEAQGFFATMKSRAKAAGIKRLAQNERDKVVERCGERLTVEAHDPSGELDYGSNIRVFLTDEETGEADGPWVWSDHVAHILEPA
jgi:hypothetical protein